MAVLDSTLHWDDTGYWDDNDVWIEAIRTDFTERFVASDDTFPTTGVYTTYDTVDGPAVITNPDFVIIYSQYELETATFNTPEPVQVLVERVRDSAVIMDSTALVATRSADLTEGLNVSDYAGPSLTVTIDVLESAIVLDTVAQSNPYTLVSEAIVVSDSQTTYRNSVHSVLESLQVNDYVATGKSQDVTDSAVVFDTVESTASLATTLVDSLVVQDYVSLTESHFVDITETFTAADLATTVLIANTVVVEQAYISGESYIPVVTTDSLVMTANTVGWAMSQYTNAPFVGKAGTYAITNDGLFVASEEYADSVLETGTTTFGTSHLKTLQYAYVDSAHENPLNLTVTADVNGEESSFEYTQMARDASDTRNVRCQFGRGFRSTYFKLRLEGEGYVQTNGCTPVVEKLGRRV